MFLPSLSVSDLLMICSLQCSNPQEYEIHTKCKFLTNGLSVCILICNHILICIWTLEWTSGTCFVGVTMSLQCLASCTDRILQAVGILRYISVVFRYEKVLLAIIMDFALSM